MCEGKRSSDRMLPAGMKTGRPIMCRKYSAPIATAETAAAAAAAAAAATTTTTGVKGEASLVKLSERVQSNA